MTRKCVLDNLLFISDNTIHHRICHPWKYTPSVSLCYWIQRYKKKTVFVTFICSTHDWSDIIWNRRHSMHYGKTTNRHWFFFSSSFFLFKLQENSLLFQVVAHEQWLYIHCIEYWTHRVIIPSPCCHSMKKKSVSFAGKHCLVWKTIAVHCEPWNVHR